MCQLPNLNQLHFSFLANKNCLNEQNNKRNRKKKKVGGKLKTDKNYYFAQDILIYKGTTFDSAFQELKEYIEGLIENISEHYNKNVEDIFFTIGKTSCAMKKNCKDPTNKSWRLLGLSSRWETSYKKYCQGLIAIAAITSSINENMTSEDFCLSLELALHNRKSNQPHSTIFSHSFKSKSQVCISIMRH
jgi:hypothetical protein